jgi:hypothetical protein
VVVAEIAFGQAFSLRHSWYEGERKPMFEFVSRVVERVLADDGDVVELSAESMTATFGEDELAAVSSMIVVQEWLLTEVGETGALARIGVTMGKLSVNKVETIGRGFVSGPAIARARALADRAANGALLVDATVVQGLVMDFLSSRAGKTRGWSGHDYLSPVAEMGRGHRVPPIAFHELLWNARSFGLAAAQNEPVASTRPDQLMRAIVQQANGGRPTLLVRPDGELFHVYGRDVVGTKPLADGDVVYFAADVKGSVPRARDVIPVGSSLTARVKKVFHDRRYAFVDVAGHDVFLHADHNSWPLEVGDAVRFTASENERGVTAIDAEHLG